MSIELFKTIFELKLAWALLDLMITLAVGIPILIGYLIYLYFKNKNKVSIELFKTIW